jgi:hypothetical protein
MFVDSYTTQGNVDKIILWGVFNLRGHRTISKNVHTLITLRHEVVFLGIHLSSVRRRLSVTPKTSSSLEPNRRRNSKQLGKEYIQKDVYNPYQIRDSYLSKCVLKTRIPRDYIAIKITLDNYDGLTDLREHV